MTKKQLLQRIRELEQEVEFLKMRVASLECRPWSVTVHSNEPYVPQPLTPYCAPSTGDPIVFPDYTICVTADGIVSKFNES